MESAITLSRESYNYRKLAQQHYNLTDEQMSKVDVHHNPPRSEGGRNIVEHLYIYSPENHAMVHNSHFPMYARKGYVNGIAKHRLSSEEQSLVAKRVYEEGKGIASLTVEERREINIRAGKISGRLHKERGTGVCAISPEEHSKRMSKTNTQRWKCPVCEYVNIARHVNKHMLNEHNLPGNCKLKTEG